MARKQRRRAALHTVVLLAAMAALLAYAGWIVDGWLGVGWGVVAGAVVFVMIRRAPIDLFLSTLRAAPLRPDEAPAAEAAVRALSRAAGLSAVPHLYRIDEDLPVAFSLGDGQSAAIVIADCLLTGLTARELIAILAHEIAHLQNHDLTLKALGVALGWLTRVLSQLGFLLILFGLLTRVFTAAQFPLVPLVILWLAPVAVGFLRLSLSRTRESEADLAAVELTGDPVGLALVLEKLQRWEDWRMRLLMPGRRIFRVPALLNDHPPTAARIARLYRMARPADAR